jgi:hypothetical protein
MSQSQTEAETLKILGSLLEKANLAAPAPAATTGACVYTAGAKTYCAVLTDAQCTVLKGAWTSGTKCA